ncbi:hypothetical protein WN943_006995 [Citrus x changshan-huyou]
MLVREATLQGDEIYKGVRDWLNRVAEFSEGVAKSIIDDKDRAKMFCFKGLCPNLISRYKLDKQVAEAANEADKLVKKGEFNIYNHVSYRPAPEKMLVVEELYREAVVSTARKLIILNQKT